MICILSIFPSILVPQYASTIATGNIVLPQESSFNPLITEYNITSTANSGPNAIIAVPNHVFWFVEYNTGKIGEFNNQSKTFNDFHIPETGALPVSLANDTSGKIWFSDQNVPSIWSFDPSTFQFRQYLTNTANSKPTFVLIDESNNVWFTDTTANNVDKLDQSTGQITKYSPPTPGSGPVEMTLQRGTSYLWVTESYANRVARFDLNNPNAGFHEFTPTVSLQNPFGIVADTNGNIWVSEHGGSSIAELIPSSSTFRKYPTAQPIGFKDTAPATLVLDAMGRIWFVEHFANKVGRLDTRTGTLDEFDIPTVGLAYSLRNALDSGGNYWFSEYSANQIGMIPWNATSLVTFSGASMLGGVVDAGHAVSSRLTILNSRPTPVTVNLGITGTFTADGQTSGTRFSLSNSSVLINPNENLTIVARITPDSGLMSGIYTAGVVATYGNTSSIGFVFLQVRGNFSIVAFLLTYLPFILAAAAVALILTQVLIKRRRSTPNQNGAKVKPPVGTLFAIILTLTVLTVQMVPPSSAKCIGYTPPPGGGGSSGPDYFGLALDLGSLAFFAIVAYLMLRNWLRKKNAADDAKYAESKAESPSTP